MHLEGEDTARLGLVEHPALVAIDGNETLTLPNHRKLDTGTCKAILRQAGQYIPEAALYPYFYS